MSFYGMDGHRGALIAQRSTYMVQNGSTSGVSEREPERETERETEREPELKEQKGEAGRDIPSVYPSLPCLQLNILLIQERWNTRGCAIVRACGKAR